MRHHITTLDDLRNWVDQATSNWDGRTDADVDALTHAVRSMDHPRWGTDWSEWLEALPDLVELLPDEGGPLVCGHQVQQDASGGHGHCWRSVNASDLPADVREEIECEMIDGKRSECDGYRASNGQYYRW